MSHDREDSQLRFATSALDVSNNGDALGTDDKWRSEQAAAELDGLRCPSRGGGIWRDDDEHERTLEARPSTEGVYGPREALTAELRADEHAECVATYAQRIADARRSATSGRTASAMAVLSGFAVLVTRLGIL
jgi:hypothetical protein